MAIAFWDDEAGYSGQDYSGNLHDFVVLGGTKSPGVCNLKIVRAHKVDQQKSKGRDGATAINTGMEPAKVDLQITIWTPSQYVLLGKLTALLFPPEGKTSKNNKGTTTAGTTKRLAWDISHPEAERMGIRSVIPLSMTSLVAGSKGERSITISMEGHHADMSKKTKTAKIDGSRNNAKLATPISQAFETSKFQSEQLMSEMKKP